MSSCDHLVAISCDSCGVACSAFFGRFGARLCPRCWVEVHWPGRDDARRRQPAWHHVPCSVCGYFNPDEMNGEQVCPLCRAAAEVEAPALAADRPPARPDHWGPGAPPGTAPALPSRAPSLQTSARYTW